MKLKRLAVTLIATSLIMGFNGMPVMAAETQSVSAEVQQTTRKSSYYEEKWIVDKEAWEEQILVSPEEGHWEKQQVLIKNSWTETIEHPAETHEEQQWVVDKEAVYETIHHDAVYEDQWVVDKEAWDEEVWEQQIHWICFVCRLDMTEAGFDQDAITQHMKAHALAGEGTGWGTEPVDVLVDVIHHPEEGHYEKVLVKEAWDEEVLVSPEEGHYETVTIIDKEAWDEAIEHEAIYEEQDVWIIDKEAVYNTITHPEEGHWEIVYTDPVAGFVDRLYTNILQRNPDDEGLGAWTEVLKSGREQGAKVAQGFIESPEFQKRNLTDAQYITILYRTFLDREPDAGGLNSWLSVLDSGLSRMHVCKGFAESNEFTKICQEYGIQRGNAILTAPMDQNEGVTKFVARCYELCLERKADADGLNAWCNQILTGANTAKEAAHGFVFSDEFKSKNLSNEEYVKTLYRVFMDREADGAGLAAWVKVLENGQSREHVFNGFADSPEFQEICAGYGL